MGKTHQPTTLMPQVDPRQRMKEVRQTVASFLNDNNPDNLNHLGELPTNMDDARRVIVALHDLVEKERTKHRKATLHVGELVQILDSMSQNEMDAMRMISARDREVHQLHQLNDMNRQEITALRRQVEHTRQQRDAVLTTMQLRDNMRAPEPVTMANCTSPMSMKDLLQFMASGKAR